METSGTPVSALRPLKPVSQIIDISDDSSEDEAPRPSRPGGRFKSKGTRRVRKEPLTAPSNKLDLATPATSTPSHLRKKPPLARAGSTTSSTSSTFVAPKSRLPSVEAAQKQYTLHFNPQEAVEPTFPLVVNKIKKPASQRVLGGSFGDRLWRVEDASKDYSWRLRERDEVSRANQSCP